MMSKDVFSEASTSAELWGLLQTDAALQLGPGDYDEQVERELRTELRLGAGRIEDEFTAHDVSVERFVAAFFVVVEPYVRMWSDLLGLFERAAATVGDNNLRVEYRFDRDAPALDFDLDRFRSVIETAEHVMARFDLSGGDLPQRLSQVLYALGAQARRSGLAGVADIDRFAQGCSEPSAPWPAAMPERQQSTHPRLDALLAEAWDLAEVVLNDIRSISDSHDALMRLPWDDERTVGVSGATHSSLRLAESDFWLSAIVLALARAANARPTSARRTSAVPASANAAEDPNSADKLDVPDDPDVTATLGLDSVADELDAALAPLRNHDPQNTEARRRLAEFLQLPIWKHRYELYSNWVCTQVIAALEDRMPSIHTDREKISFSFSGTHLATFDGFTPRLHIWTELCTPLANPVHDGPRRGAIKPDVVLVSDPITAQRSPLVVECKQYRRANNKGFANAITDYGHGHPDAQIVLVDYGRARAESVIGRVDEDVRPRTTVIGEFHPGRHTQIQAFRAAVREAVGIVDRVVVVEEERASSQAGVSAVGHITLRWAATPADLDLHVKLAFADRESAHIYYGGMGSVDEHPFCELADDCQDGHGPEIVTIARWLPATYTVVVHRYTEDAPMAESEATVALDLDGQTREFRCPRDIEGDEWTVCTIDGATQSLL